MDDSNKEYQKAFSKHFRELLKERGISVASLSRLTGINQTMLTRYANTVSIPSYDKLEKIATVLDYTIDDFFDFKNENITYSPKWRQSKSYPQYELNTDGRIRNAKTGVLLKTTVDEKGYEQVQLRKGNKPYTERVHRLMADTFLDLSLIHI